MDVDSSSKFIASLTKFLQSLCNGYVDFENGVELVGHIYLSVDTGKKIDYILHEKVCKNDENSVTFISNSFHAQPFDKARSQTKQQTDTSKGKPRSEKIKDADKEDTAIRKDDDDDVVIVNAPKVGAENSDSSSMGVRGRKRPASPNSEQQQFQRPLRRSAEASLPSSSSPSSMQQSGQGSSGVPLQSSNGLRRKTAPSATVTSQEDHPDNFNSSDLKLEHMTTDELLSLASQVSDSSCSTNIIPPSSGSGSRSGGGDPSCQQVWVKQEVLDDDDSCLASGSGDSAHGQSWPVGRDPQSDANSGSSGLYPVMLHQNTAFPGPGGPFPPGFHGSPSSSQHPAFAQQSSSQGAANLFANPVPGTSQGGAVDPADVFLKSDFNNQVQAQRSQCNYQVRTLRSEFKNEDLRPSPAVTFCFLQTSSVDTSAGTKCLSQQVNAPTTSAPQSILPAANDRKAVALGSEETLTGRWYPCATCKIAFSSKRDFFRHGKNCRSRRPVVCGVCGEAFSSVSSLKDHEKAKHSSQVYACLCGRVFNWRPSYNRHKRNCIKQRQ